jgi:hypothetical protein
MKKYLLNGGALLGFFLAFLPTTLRAQEFNYCSVFFCTAFGYFDSDLGDVVGYAEYYDDTYDFYLGVKACSVDPFGSPHDCEENEDYDDVTATTGYTPDANGQWFTVGLPWYDDGDDGPERDGPDYYYYDTDEQPTGEDDSYNSNATIGIVFSVQLQPYTFDFDWYQTAEVLGDTTDNCYSTYHATAGPAHATAASPLNTVGDVYGDLIAAPTSYYEAYRDATASSGTSCSWSVFQQMTYNGGAPYTSRYLSWQVQGTSVQVCRTNCYTATFF